MAMSYDTRLELTENWGEVSGTHNVQTRQGASLAQWCPGELHLLLVRWAAY